MGKRRHDITAELLGLLLIEGADGQPLYQNVDAVAFLSRFAIDFVDAVGLENAPATFVRSVQNVLARAGVTPDEVGDALTVSAKVRAYFEARPVPPGLWSAYQQFLRRRVLARSDVAQSSKLENLLARDRTDYLNLNAAPPEGSLSIIGIRSAQTRPTRNRRKS